MSTVTVITTDSFMLIDPTNDQHIEPLTPTEVEYTTFIEERVSLGQLALVEPVAITGPEIVPESVAAPVLDPVEPIAAPAPKRKGRK